jgi:hypothetical protein
MFIFLYCQKGSLFMLAAFIGQTVLASSSARLGIGTFLQASALASYWHQDFATCVSFKTMPTTLRETLAAR